MENNKNGRNQFTAHQNINVESCSGQQHLNKPNTDYQNSQEINKMTCEKIKQSTKSLIKNLDPRSVNIQKPKKRWYKRKGHWNLQQNARYYLFLKSYLDEFVLIKQRRLEKIFKQMSYFIPTRTANQCRSHHQKQQKKHIQFDILMVNLYQITKNHHLLENQPPFSKQDPIYRGVFDVDYGQQDSNNQIKWTKDRRSLITYEMPQTLQMISEAKYRELFGQFKLYFY